MIRLSAQTLKPKSAPHVRVLLAFENETGFANGFGVVGGRLRKTLAAEGLKGRESEGVWSAPGGVLSPERVIVVGLGPRDKCRVESFRRAGGRAARIARQAKATVLAVEWPARGLKGTVAETVKAFAEGLILGNYRFLRYKTREEDQQGGLERVEFQAVSEILPSIRKALLTAEIYCDGVILARDLINGAPSDVTPDVLVQTAFRIASQDKHVRVNVYGRKELQQMGAGG
jgi:leucyl aminopeptidase